MVYIVYNIILSISLIIFTGRVNAGMKKSDSTDSFFAVPLLYSTLASILFTFLLIIKEHGYATFIGVSMRIVLAAEGIALTLLSFAFIEIGCKEEHKILDIIKMLLFVGILYITFFKIKYIELSPLYGISVKSDFLFTGYLRNFIPITWFQLYIMLTKFVIPIMGFLFLILLQEHHKATQLEKYQSIILGSGFLVMWLIYLTIKYISKASLETSYLYMFSYSYMYIVMYMGLGKTTVPSGKAIYVSIFKVLVSYVLPGSLVAFLCSYFQPIVNSPMEIYIFTFSIYGTILILYSIDSSYLLSSSTKLYTADYGAALEKDLASIEYRETDMDEITERMNEILRKHADASSLNVYILSNPSELMTAYSSNNLNKIILTNSIMFDALLNINKNVVIYSEIEKEHSLASIQDELKDFFEYTESDALFILNEGHNIFGVITLGKKNTGENFKSYDYNVFVNLYSYFFVFGYYMRNIANKDIIGVVNREIRMSSQIITSIQENLDKVKSPKVDIGYLMVPAHNIGGEFIDLIRLTDTRHLFVVGDLSGKGIGASMNMVILKSIIRTHLAEIHDFKELVVRLNKFVRYSLPKGVIFYGLFALIDFETDTMYYINCGIPALMMYNQVYNNIIEIQGSGHVLGFVDDITPYISVKTTKLNNGDIILACTDGLVTSHSLRGESFGKERIQQAILDNSTYNAQRMAQFIFDGLIKFMSKEMEDDVSILVLKYEGSTKESSSGENVKVESTKKDSIIDVDVSSNIEEVNISETEKPLAKDNVTVEEKEEVVSNKEEVTVSASDDGSSVEVPMGEYTQSPLPNGEMPDLSDLDELLKEAGL